MQATSEFQFMCSWYEYPFIYDGRLYTNIDRVISDAITVMFRSKTVNYSSYSQDKIKHVLDDIKKSLSLSAYKVRFSSDPMKYRLRSVVIWPSDLEYIHIGKEEQELLMVMSSEYNNETEAFNADLDYKVEENMVGGPSRLARLVYDKLYRCLGIKEINYNVRETLLLGAWELDNALMVCSITRPRVSNCVITIKGVDESAIRLHLEKEMSIQNKDVLRLKSPNIKSVAGGTGSQCMGCAAQFAYDVKYGTFDERTINVSLSGSYVNYTLFGSDGTIRNYKHTDRMNRKLQENSEGLGVIDQKENHNLEIYCDYSDDSRVRSDRSNRQLFKITITKHGAFSIHSSMSSNQMEMMVSRVVSMFNRTFDSTEMLGMISYLDDA